VPLKPASLDQVRWCPFAVGDRTTLNMCLMLLTCNVAGFVFPTPSSIGEPCGEEYGVAVKYFEKEVGGYWSGN